MDYDKSKQLYKIHEKAQLVILDNVHYKALHDFELSKLKKTMDAPSTATLKQVLNYNHQQKKQCFGQL